MRLPKLRWPLMWKSTHTIVLDGIRAHFQRKVDAKYQRARDEGRAQVHSWAVEVNYNIFYGNHPWQGTQRQQAYAALQEAEHQFAPTRTQLEAPKEN